MTVDIKSYNQRLGLMVRKILADTGLSDLRVGSVISSILEAAAQSDFEIETSIVEMIKLFSIDTTSGADLDNRAKEFNLTRFTAQTSSDVVRLGDSSFTKKSSKIYIGLPPPVIGDTVINVEDASSFPASGQVYIGRGTGNYEGPLTYSSLTNNTSYWTINLSVPVTKSHTSVETVILAQGGNRVVNAGTTVLSPANNFSPAVAFAITRAVTIPDGETVLDNVPVIAKIAGTIGNVPAGAISNFAAAPFLGATVTNITSYTNGRDVELDSDLRTRIRNVIQLIARGTKRSILQAVIGTSDATENKRVVSASLSEPLSATLPAQLYIDDGTGFEPSFDGQGVELVVDEASGREEFIQLSKFPVTPPIIVSGADQPYGLQPGDTLTIRVDNTTETITFIASDFAVPGSVRASEVISAINRQSGLLTARSIRNKSAVALVAKRFFDGTDPESMQIIAGSANSSLQFPVTVARTLSLYKNGVLLKKNAASAFLYTEIVNNWSFGLSTAAVRFKVQVDGTAVQDITINDTDFLSFATTYKLATAEQWATVLSARVAGASAIVESGAIKLSSNKANSSSSQLSVIVSSNLTSRSTTDAIWQSGNTVRYSVANTDGILAGDLITVSGFVNASNNGIFPATRIAPNDYVELTTGRSNATDDETSVITASLSPNKEDFTLIAFGGAQSSVGASSEYALNRFSGQIQLATKLIADEHVEAGSEFTKAYIDSLPSSSGRYSFPIQQDVIPALYLTFDATSAKRTYLISIGDILTQGRVGVTDNVELKTNRSGAFTAAQAGDFVFLSTKSVSGTGVGYSPWFPSYATGVYEITSVIDTETVYIKNPDPSYPTLPSMVSGTVSSTDDIQVFQTGGLVQRVPLSGTNLLPSSVVDQIATTLQFGEAVVFNNQYVRIQSNSFSELDSKVFVLATAGSAKNLYLSGASGTANQPHVGYQVAVSEGTSFLRLKDGIAGFFSNTVTQTDISGDTTSADLSVPYANIDSTQAYSTDLAIDNVIKYISGNNNQQILALRTIDSATQITPQEYNGIRPIYESDKYLIAESYKFSAYDKLIIELDQDSTNKTFTVPIYRTGKVKGVVTTTQFDGYDLDAAPGTDFNNAMWNDFSFQDFAMMFRARNIYKSSAVDSSLIIRSKKFGAAGNLIRLGLFYPGSANQAPFTLHSISSSNVDVRVFLGSGLARTGISAVGAGYKVSRAGSLFTINYASVGAAPNFSGNGVLVGDIVNITDAAFASKSSFFIGAGKVTSVSATSLTVKLTGTSTISTSYAATAAQDSGSGTTTTYLVANTGLLASGDTVEVSGFTRTINNGIKTVVGVVTNTSVTVNSTNRTVIASSTLGYRRTSNVASLQFASSLTGQVFSGDTIVISSMSEPSLNGTFTVSSITTTIVANDTLTFTVAGIDLPVARTVTDAIWQSGTLVRYAATNTGGITIGNTVEITGFANSANNGTFLVTNVSLNNWIEVTSSRTDGTLDESGVIGALARPTYFISDTGGSVAVLNNETAASTVDLIITQANTIGISAYPLSGNTANAIASVINADPFVSNIITAVNAQGYTGTGLITEATFDEAISVGYNHTVGDSFISLYDGDKYCLDFTSANINPSKNFTLKQAFTFSHPDYDATTAPNITGETSGEYFKLIPTTYRNVTDWINKPSVTSFSVLGSAQATSNGGALQLSSQTIGTAGAVTITGGSANGIPSFIKTLSSIDGGAIRCQVNNADLLMFEKNQIVKVENFAPSRKPLKFIAGNTIDVQNVNSTTGRFKSKARTISLAATNSITITDVSATYGRSAGIVWRWTATGTPAAAFLNSQVGDALHVSNSSFDPYNSTPASFGDGFVSSFPIIGVDSSGNWIDVHNPYGVSEPAILVGSPVNISVSPAFLVEWKHYMSSSAVMKVESLQFRNLYKYSYVSGGPAPLWAENGACVEDYVVISGNSFLPENRGTFRLVAVSDSSFIIENVNGSEEASVNIDLAEDLRFFYSESVLNSDILNVSDSVFLEPNRGSHTVVNFGTDSTLKTQYLTVSIANSSAQTGVSLTGLANTFFVTDGVLYSAYKKISNFAIDPSDRQYGIVYCTPPTNVHKISNTANSSITPVQKLGFSGDTAIGLDGYQYYTGLLATVQKVVDGYDPDPQTYPGYKAAGTQIEPVPPLIRDVTVNVIVKPKQGINLNAVSDSIKSAVLNYIKGLGVGDDVIVSEITSSVMSIEGVESATLFEPSPSTERIVIQDNEKAVISIDNITVSSS